MRGIVKTSHYSHLQELLSAVNNINQEEYRYQDVIKNVVQSAFGKDIEPGIIAQRVEYYQRNSPLQWAEELDSIVKAFAPEGPLMSGDKNTGLINTADRSVPIDSKILPKSVISEFTGIGDRQSSKLRNLKRQFGDKFYINNWQWLWCNIAHSLILQPELQQKRSISQDQQQDQLYYMLTRNPYLIIIRKALQYNYRKDTYLMQRMRGVLELYFIQDLFNATKKRQGKLQYKYHLKSHYIALVFLLIWSRKGKFQGQTLQIYDQFFVKATEHYSSVTNHSNSQNVRYLIRVWLYLLTREHSPDSTIVLQADNANPKDGWYRLSRCPLQQWGKAIKKTQFLSYQLRMLIQMRKSVYKMISRSSEWIPSFAFLSVIEQFLLFQDTVISKYVRRGRDKEDDNIMSKCFQRILIHLAENGANSLLLQKLQQRINITYNSKLEKKIEINFKVRSEQARQMLSRTSRQRMKRISYQNPRMKNVWQHPLQQNQFYILYQMSYWISKQLDKIIPGHQKRNPKHPCVNIRILSNPYIFFIFIISMIIFFRWILEV